MKPPILLLVVALVVNLSACTYGRMGESQKPQAQDQTFGENITTAQTRINRYFQNAVVTAAWKECWSRLKGEGLIAMDFTYRKAKDTWVFEKIAVKKSTLPEGQDAVALRCMEESARTTSFPVEMSNGPERAANAFVIRWTWPAPMPTTKEQMAARMIGGGGLGDVAGCSECVERTDYPYGLKCESRDRGGHLDCREESTNVCSTASTSCLRGSFGIAGGVVIF